MIGMSREEALAEKKLKVGGGVAQEKLDKKDPFECPSSFMRPLTEGDRPSNKDQASEEGV